MVGVKGFQVNPMIWYLSLDEMRQSRKIMLVVMLPERSIAFAGNRENALNRKSDVMILCPSNIMWILVFILLAFIAYTYYNNKCERCEGLCTNGVCQIRSQM
jgi:hypothetical protein